MHLFAWILKAYKIAFRKTKYGPLIALAVLLLGLIGNTACFMFFDGQSLSDSIWYSVISVTTIGYGDFSATSLGARLGTFIFIVLFGLGSFSYLIGWVIDRITTAAQNRRNGMSKAFANSGHILIVNFPNELRVKQIIEETRSDEKYKDVEFVIVTDSITHLPFEIPGVEFVKGSPIEVETFEQARCCDASAAYVMSTDYNDPQSDALVSTTVGVIEGMCPDVRTIAECLQRKHMHFFEKLGCDSIVCASEIGINLMVQELQDHGVTEVFNTITSNIKTGGDTLFSAEVDKIDGVFYYNDLAHSFVDADGNLVSVKRKDEDFVHTNFPKGMSINKGDTIVFTADHRYTTQELLNFAKIYGEKARKAFGTEKYQKVDA